MPQPIIQQFLEDFQGVEHFHLLRNSGWCQNVCHICQSKSNLWIVESIDKDEQRICLSQLHNFNWLLKYLLKREVYSSVVALMTCLPSESVRISIRPLNIARNIAMENIWINKINLTFKNQTYYYHVLSMFQSYSSVDFHPHSA